MAALAVGAALLTALAGSGSSPAEADGGPNRRGLSVWWPYYGNGNAATLQQRREAFAGNIDLFEEISPFWYRSSPNGPAEIIDDGTAANMNLIKSIATSRGVPVVPSIRDGSGKGVLAGWFADPAARSQHADALVNLVVRNGFAGIDLDYEGFAFSDGRTSWPALQPNWVAFVQELSGKLHAQGKQLHVTVPPIWLNASGGVDTGSYTVYDWARIGPHVDGLRVMTYDYSARAVSPQWWVEATIAYARSIGFDMTKLQVGIPLYGKDTVTDTDGQCPPGTPLGTRSVSHLLVDERIAEHGASPARDSATGEMRFTYQESSIGDGAGSGPTDPPTPEPVPKIGGLGTATATAGAVRLGSCTVTRTVSYLDEFAVAQRARTAVDAGAGVALWALGMDESWTWSALRGQLAVQR